MTEQIIEFLNQIGISVHRQSIEGETALPVKFGIIFEIIWSIDLYIFL